MDKAEDIALKEGEKYGINEAMVIYTSKIDVRDYVLLKCRFGCTRYGLSYNCPPNTPTPDETRKILAEYKKAVLVGGDVQGFEEQKKIAEGILAIERALFLKGYYKAFGLTPGACTICNICSVHEDKPCKHPEKCRPSMESMGIDVFSTLKRFKKNLDVIKDRTKFICYGLILLE